MVVVYKVDRLTRALSDFARLVDVFDRRGVSFVSITQQFNTTTSMGRLTLNVLLSFAQFEREVIGERVRDKIAASKKKGMWMGGMPPLGYDVKDRKLNVNEDEAKIVVDIFQRYLALKSVRALRDELADAGIRSKRRLRPDGSAYGGQTFSRGALYLMLQNRLYRGEVRHKGQCYPGEHAAIVDAPLWDEVQAALAANRVERATGARAKAPSLLTGMVFDEEGQRLRAREVAIDRGESHDAAVMAVFDETVPPLDAAIDPDLIPFLGMTDIIDRNVVVLAPEERYGVEAFALPEHIARCSLALPFGNDPVLDPDVCTTAGIGPARDVAGREDASRRGFENCIDRDAAVSRKSRLLGQRQARPDADTKDDHVGFDRPAALQYRPLAVHLRHSVLQMEDDATLFMQRTHEVAHLGPQDALHRPLLRGNDMNLEIPGAQGSRDLETDEARADNERPLRAARRGNDRAAVGERAKRMDTLPVCSGDLKPHGLCARGKQEAVERHRISIGQLHAAPFRIDGHNRRVEAKVDAGFGVEIVRA